MAKIFITGSSQGLGLMAGQLLLAQGHDVVLHARDAVRADATRAAAPGGRDVVVGDVSTLAAMRALAAGIDRHGPFDAVIHNVGVGYRESHRVTADGLPHVFAINVLAPYVLTALLARSGRIVWLSSGMHFGASPHLDDLTWSKRRWQGSQAYAESKLYDTVLAFAVARRWPDVRSNALEPGWVPTRMGGPGAPDDMDKAHRTQAWLATSDEAAACVSGRYFFHMREKPAHPAASDADVQDRLLAECARLSGLSLPA